MCGENKIMHKHHIIPRYMGGSNKKENLVEVTVTQHAMFHYCNYQLWGNEEDRVAWIGLSGIVSKQQIVYEATIIAQRKATEAAKNPKARKKQIESLKRIKHQQGDKNSQYGKMWITDGTKEGSYRINKSDPIPDGYKRGRVCFDIKPIGKDTANYGKIWITNGIESKMIYETEIIPDGFRRGMTIKPQQPLPQPSTTS